MPTDFAAGLASIRDRIEQQIEQRLQASRTALEQWGDDAEQYMEANAPWTDRSGDARTGLESTPVHPPELRDGGAVALHHSVFYGRFLEADPDFEIIRRTVAAEGPRLVNELEHLW